jgi:protoporphyrinogen oxidase
MKNIAILGAGIGGMAAAYDLRLAGHQVTIYEAMENVGGLASGFKEPHWDWYVEKFYHHWFASDRHMLGLIDELGWRDQVIFKRPYTVIYHEGRFHPFDSMFTNILNSSYGITASMSSCVLAWLGCICA